MRMSLIVLAAAVPLAGCSTTGTRMVEADGMPRGALAVAAIERGDMAKAEQLLAGSPLDADNPARLINLGYVHLQQGRREAAMRAWRQALAADIHSKVVTMDGREISTDRLAREALARYGMQQVAAR